jgi:excisionase family DNA binding protein
MREPWTKQDLPRWLQEQAAILECLIRFGEPARPERFFQEEAVSETVRNVRRVSARFGIETAGDPTDPQEALLLIGRVLDQIGERPKPDSLLTVTEVAGRLKVNRDKVLGWIAYGRLPAVNTAKSQLGRPRYRVRPADLDEFLAGRQA